MSAAREWSDLSAEARSAKVDVVAKQLVDVQEDAELAARIASALPERRSRFFWLIPQLGAVAALVVAAVVWSNHEAPAPPLATIAMVPLRAAVDAVEPFRPIESLPLVRIEPLEPLEPSDHERSLPAIEAPGVLAMSDLAPRDLPVVEALTLQPLEIGELPLTGESFPPREF